MIPITSVYSATSSSSAFAPFRSAVSKPSASQLQMPAIIAHALSRRSCDASRRAMLVVTRNSPGLRAIIILGALLLALRPTPLQR